MQEQRKTMKQKKTHMQNSKTEKGTHREGHEKQRRKTFHYASLFAVSLLQGLPVLSVYHCTSSDSAVDAPGPPGPLHPMMTESDDVAALSDLPLWLSSGNYCVIRTKAPQSQHWTIRAGWIGSGSRDLLAPSYL